MGKRKWEWQDAGYVLGYFGKSLSGERRAYYSYVKAGVKQGRRPELVGGGLIQSHGDWQAVKKAGKKASEKIKGRVLEESEDRFERYYEMKRLGYDLKTVEDRVCQIFDIGRKDIYSGNREKIKAEARGLFCYWAARELGYGLTDLSRRLGMTRPGVGYAVKRGEQYVEENNYRLRETLLFILPAPHSPCPSQSSRPEKERWVYDR